MLFTDAVYVGIDPTAGTKPMDYVALDADLKPVAIDQGGMEEILAFVAGLEAAAVAVNGPQGLGKGLLEDPERRRRFGLNPNAKTWSQWRVSEFELRRRNIRLYKTPAIEERVPGWMRTGFQLHRRLRQLGFRPFRAGEDLPRRAVLETNPHACFNVLLERRPFLKRTLEGRLQRQLVLYLAGIDIYNPLHALEEITRHRLLTGNLPLEGLHKQDPLDAMAAAYTAYLVSDSPERVCQVGDPAEGFITLPVAELKTVYA